MAPEVAVNGAVGVELPPAVATDGISVVKMTSKVAGRLAKKKRCLATMCTQMWLHA